MANNRSLNLCLDDNCDEKQEVNEWLRFGISLGVSTALHPFDYSITLMQLGYEPIPPVPGKSILGKSILLLPNIFQYSAHIRKIDGIYGCYRGIAPKLFGFIATKICKNQITAHWEAAKVDEQLKYDEDSYFQLTKKLKRELVLCTAGVIVSQPFHVISVRMMAEFVGRETLYASMAGALREIYKTEGLQGFFNGLLPRLISDVGCLFLTTTTVFLLNKYFIKDKGGRSCNAFFTQFAYSSILYPFQVVSTCMCVSGSRLSAGKPPHMPLYKNSLDCLIDLAYRGDLKRGSSFLLRSTRKLEKSSANQLSAYQENISKHKLTN